MKDEQTQKKDILQSNGNEDACDFGQRQARIEMKKEDDRKQITKMMKRI